MIRRAIAHMLKIRQSEKRWPRLFPRPQQQVERERAALEPLGEQQLVRDGRRASAPAGEEEERLRLQKEEEGRVAGRR